MLSNLLLLVIRLYFLLILACTLFFDSGVGLLLLLSWMDPQIVHMAQPNTIDSPNTINSVTSSLALDTWLQ